MGQAGNPSRVGVGLLGLCLAALPGCREFQHHQADLEATFAAGRYDQAAAMLDDPKVHAMYGEKSELLWKLDRGSVALAMGQDDQAIDLLNKAEAQIELQSEKSGADVLGQWAINDTAAKYIAEPYEDVYVNVIKILAQLDAGRIDGGATVEARRMAGKADMLRERWLKYDDAVSKKGGPALKSAEGSGGFTAVNNKGEFLESTLGTFLTAVTFMKSGDREFQRVAGKRLVDSIKLQQGLIGPVKEEDFAGLDEMNPDDANLLIVALSGRGPTKYAQRIGPIPLGTVPLYMELPQLRTFPSDAANARIEVDGEGAQAGSVHKQPLKFVEDLSAVATENHKRALPGIYARTFVRYAIKAGISTTLTEVARRGAHDSDQGLVQIAGVLAGLAVIGATEEADLRCWLFLPGQARVGLMKLEPGHHKVRIVYESASGGDVFATAWKDVDISEGGGGLTSVVGHYWR